jgi:uncharacterized protein YutE (UPF0331/DUF86 family)
MDYDLPDRAPIAQVVAAAQAGTPARTIMERLVSKFGLGDNPVKRRALYARLQLLAETFPDAVESLISEAVMQSHGMRRPGNYFCRAIVLKLRESKLMQSGGTPCTW